MIEEKHLTAEAQAMLSQDDLFIAFGVNWYDKPLKDMEIFADGLGDFLSPKELEKMSRNNWKCVPLGDQMLIGQLGNGNLFTLPPFLIDRFTKIGAINIRGYGDVSDITYLDLQNPDGFIVGFKSEINKLQQLVKDNEAKNI